MLIINAIYRHHPMVRTASVHNMEEDRRWEAVLRLQRVPTWRLALKFLVLKARLSILASIDSIGRSIVDPLNFLIFITDNEYILKPQLYRKNYFR